MPQFQKISYLYFGAGVTEEVDLTKVVSGDKKLFTVGPTTRVDIGTIRSFRPDTWKMKDRCCWLLQQ